MDRRERFESPQSAFLAALQGAQSDIWTALPGIVQSFDPSKQTCTIQPAVQARINDPDGSFHWAQLPVLLDCPVYFPKGGGVTLTFPVKKGDECLVVFSSRCIDAWWQHGGIQQQPVYRMHDLSDGFAFVGISSVPNVIGGISTATAQLRTDDGLAYAEINPSNHDINVVTPSNVTGMVGGNLTLTVTGNVVANVTGSVSISSDGAASVTTKSTATVTATGAANVVSSAAINATAPAINLGASGQSLLALVTSAFVNLFNGHTHTTTTTNNPTSAPNQTMGSSHLSSTVKGG